MDQVPMTTAAGSEDEPVREIIGVDIAIGPGTDRTVATMIDVADDGSRMVVQIDASLIPAADLGLIDTPDLVREVIADEPPAAETSVVTASAEDVVAHASEDTIYLGRPIRNDWDPELFIVDLYEQYLQAVEQAKTSSPLVRKNVGRKVYDQNTVFEDYLTDCYNTLTWQFEKLNREYGRGEIDLRSRANALALREGAQEAIVKYLEKSPRGRLTGV